MRAWSLLRRARHRLTSHIMKSGLMKMPVSTTLTMAHTRVSAIVASPSLCLQAVYKVCRRDRKPTRVRSKENLKKEAFDTLSTGRQRPNVRTVQHPAGTCAPDHHNFTGPPWRSCTADRDEMRHGHPLADPRRISLRLHPGLAASRATAMKRGWARFLILTLWGCGQTSRVLYTVVQRQAYITYELQVCTRYAVCQGHYSKIKLIESWNEASISCGLSSKSLPRQQGTTGSRLSGDGDGNLGRHVPGTG